MSGKGKRSKSLWADAVRWRERVDDDLLSEEGKAAAGDLGEFILNAVGRIAGQLGRGDDLISQQDAIGQAFDQSSRPISAQHARRVVEWLEARGHVVRVDADLIRPVRKDELI
jgi:hypothetical protein